MESHRVTIYKAQHAAMGTMGRPFARWLILACVCASGEGLDLRQLRAGTDNPLDTFGPSKRLL
jgi:hypothetical protein